MSRLEVDHVIPRSQGGPSVVENGLVLCGPWGCDAHGLRTRREIKIQRDWLDPDQIEWLAEQGWVRWTPDGLEGRGLRNFAEVSSYEPGIGKEESHGNG